MFEQFVGKLVKVVFQDGSRITVSTGILSEVSGSFIRVGDTIISLLHLHKVELVNHEKIR